MTRAKRPRGQPRRNPVLPASDAFVAEFKRLQREAAGIRAIVEANAGRLRGRDGATLPTPSAAVLGSVTEWWERWQRLGISLLADVVACGERSVRIEPIVEPILKPVRSELADRLTSSLNEAGSLNALAGEMFDATGQRVSAASLGRFCRGGPASARLAGVVAAFLADGDAALLAELRDLARTPALARTPRERVARDDVRAPRSGRAAANKPIRRR